MKEELTGDRNFAKMLDEARRYRDGRLCKRCSKLQREVDRLRALVKELEKNEITSD